MALRRSLVDQPVLVLDWFNVAFGYFVADSNLAQNGALRRHAIWGGVGLAGVGRALLAARG